MSELYRMVERHFSQMIHDKVQCRFLKRALSPEKKYSLRDFLGGSVGKEPACNAGDTGDSGSIPGSGRSSGGGNGNGNPLQYSCLGNPVDRGAWRATVHRVEKELDMNLNHMCKTLTPFIKTLQPEHRVRLLGWQQW